MPGKLIRTLYHFCWYALATVIILAAVSITLLRMALPDIGVYREDIQVWISDYMGYPVEIHDINADWEGWIPNLYLDDIRVINESTGQPLISFDQASVTLDLVSSIRHREFIPHRIRVSGLDLSLIRFADGSVSLVRAGEDTQNVPEKSRKNELGQWFRNQKRIEINNVSVNWLDLQKDLHPVRFTDASIKIHSDGERMQVTGSATTDQHHEPARFEYALDIYGHMHTTNWSGQIYITADRIDPGYWSDYFRFNKVRFGNTPGKIELWSEWKQAKLVHLDGQVEYNKLDIQDYLLEGIEGDVRLSRNRNDDWLVNLNLQEFTTPEGSWPGITAEIDIPSEDLTVERRLQAHISYLKLDDVYNLLGSSEILDRFGLTSYSIGGELNDLHLITDLAGNGDNFWIDTGISHLVLNDEDGLQLSGISGHLSAENGKGRFYLNSDKAEFGLTGYYDQPLWFYNSRGTIDWKTDGDKINIRTDAIGASTSDFSFNLFTTVEINRDGEAYLDLLASISPVRVESVLDYLPQSGGEEISEWMKSSILGGRLLKTDIVLRGPVSDFPFRNNEGLFQLITQIENSTLEYDPEWPPIDNLNAEIQIRNNSLEILADSGNVFSSILSNTVARIPDMSTDKPHVYLQGQFEGTVRDSALFISQSPLNDIRSLEMIKNEELSGPLSLDLELDIPLYDKDTEIKGHLVLPGNELNSSQIGVNLTDLMGEVRFTRHSIESEKLRARYFDREIDLAIMKSPDSDRVTVSFTGSMDRDFLRKQFNHYFPNSTVMVNDYIEHLSGASTWEASLNFEDTDTGVSTDSTLLISSDLIGMNVELPAPLAKERTRALPVKLSTVLNDESSQILDFQIGDVFAARLEYSEHGERIIDALRVNFGGQLDQLTSTKGIRIEGHVNEVSLSNWINLIQKNMRDREKSEKPGHDDIDVNVVISRLEFFNQLFTDVQLNITKKPDDWQINVRSDAIAGLISIPFNENVIVLDLTHLYLAENDDRDREPATDFDPARIPSIHAHVENVVYGSKHLGEMYLETSRLERGLSFDELTFTKPELKIKGYGRWTRENNQNVSKFTFDINADSLNSMLSTFQFTDAAIKDGRTSINLEAKWNGRPVDFSLDNINGQLDMLIEKGQFLDINPKAGRLFGLLSLQTLPRRLALDFTDIFGEGLSFDTIQGVFTIQNGNAYTNNLLMTGPTANIAVTGRTGLIDKDYDQVVTVTPQISDSLPVASALFGPIGVGVGAVIYFAGELFESIPDQIDRILQYQYTITGSWENPQVKELKDGASS